MSDLTSDLEARIEKIKDKTKVKRAEIVKEYGDLYRKAYNSPYLQDWQIVEIHRTLEDLRRCEECNGECYKENADRGYRITFELYGKNNSILSRRRGKCKHFTEKEKAEEIKEKVQRADIPAKYLGLSFKDYKVDEGNKEAIRYAKRTLDNPAEGLFIYGNYGVGKTMLAAIIANELLKQGKTVLFTKVLDFLRNIRSTFDKKSEVSELEMLTKFYECDCLIFDDVRPERGTKFASEQLFELIDFRYTAKVPIIITSNGTLEEIRDALNYPTDTNGAKVLDGDRIYDRCTESMRVVKIEGESRRRKL